MTHGFDFSWLLDKYSEPFTRIDSADGHYGDRGRWVPGQEIEVPMEGVIQPLSASDLQYDEPGTWTRNDRKVFTQEPLTIGQRIRHRGNTYTVQEEVDHGTHGHYYVYHCRREGVANG